MSIIYTFGYAGQSVDKLFRWVQENDALLFDIRFSPYSRDPTWNTNNLARRFSNRYRHMASLGNRNYKGGPTDIVNLDAGVSAIARCSAHPIVLMCVCKNFHECHRSEIASHLHSLGYETSELVLTPNAQAHTPPKRVQLKLF